MHRLTRFSLAHPKASLLVLALITAGLAGGVPRVQSEYGYRVLIGDTHPAIRTLDAFIDRFGGGLPTQIVWECGESFPCKSVFDHTSVLMAASISKELSPLPFVNSVVGPHNAPVLVPSHDGFEVRRVVENGDSIPSDIDTLTTRALEDPLWINRIVSADGTVGRLMVQAVDNQGSTDVALVEAIQNSLIPFEEQGFVFYLVGDSIATVVTGRELDQSMARLVPVLVIITMLILFALFRSWGLTIAAVLTMGVALLWAYGVIGWIGWPEDGILEVLAPLILVVGICDAVHLISHYASSIVETESEPRTRANRILSSAESVSSPCLVTSLTTAGAFLSFTTSSLGTFERFGATAAFGVLACLLLTFTLLPVIIWYLPSSVSPPQRISNIWRSALDGVVRSCRSRAGWVVFASGFILAVCAYGWIFHLKVDNNWLESFGEKSRAVQWIRFVESRLGPVDTLEVDVALPSTQDYADPATLESIARFSDHVSEIEGLGTATSLLDVLKRINRLLHDDSPEFERVAGSTQANAEIIELMSFDDPTGLSTWLSLDRQHVRVSIEASERSYTNRARLLDSLNAFIDQDFPSEWDVSLSGAIAINFDWIRDVQSTQVRSFPTAFLIVFILVSIFLRSVRLALAAMVTTLMPVVVTLGAMGWIGMNLDIGRAMIAAVLLGIGIDDSIHVLSRYRSLREEGSGPSAAIQEAIVSVGRAVVSTSFALAAGFLVLMASPWQTISSFGFFISLAILGALASTLFVLPALIFRFSRNR